MIRRLLDLIGHQPQPNGRPYLWYIGRHGSVVYPRTDQRASLRIRLSKWHPAPVRATLGRVAFWWDRQREWPRVRRVCGQPFPGDILGPVMACGLFVDHPGAHDADGMVWR